MPLRELLAKFIGVLSSSRELAGEQVERFEMEPVGEGDREHIAICSGSFILLELPVVAELPVPSLSVPSWLETECPSSSVSEAKLRLPFELTFDEVCERGEADFTERSVGSRDGLGEGAGRC